MLKRLRAAPAPAVLLDEEGAQARVGSLGEGRHPAPCPFEGRVILAVLPAQLGDLKEAVAAREVPFCHRDLLGEAPGALCEGLHDLRKRLKMGTGVVERRHGVTVIPKPGESNRDAVLTESALAPHRARAGEAKLLTLGAKLDRVALGALDGGADSSGACPQRTHPTRFEIGKAALVGARRRRPATVAVSSTCDSSPGMRPEGTQRTGARPEWS